MQRMKLNHSAHRRNISNYYNDTYRVVKHFNIRIKRTAIFYELKAETANLVSTALIYQLTRRQYFAGRSSVTGSDWRCSLYVTGSKLDERRYFFPDIALLLIPKYLFAY